MRGGNGGGALRYDVMHVDYPPRCVVTHSLTQTTATPTASAIAKATATSNFDAWPSKTFYHSSRLVSSRLASAARIAARLLSAGARVIVDRSL